jgi:hypothetical protein
MAATRVSRIALWSVAALGAALAPAAESRAAVTVGSSLALAPVVPNECFTSGCTVIQELLPGRQVTVPAPGVVVRWRVRTGLGSVAQPAQLRVVRRDPGLRSVAESAPVTLPGGPAVAEFATRLPIAAGDGIGIDCCSLEPAVISRPLDTAVALSVFPPLSRPSAFVTTEDEEVTLNADIEPDADRDGFGDETQDGCPAGAATAGPCPVAAPVPVQPVAAPAPAPRLTGLALAPRAFRRSTTVSFTLSEAASVTFSFARTLPGRRAGGRCVAPTRRNRRARRCTRDRALAGTIVRRGAAGANRVRLAAVLGGRRLGPGRYRLAAVATAASGRRSAVRRVALRIVRR